MIKKVFFLPEVFMKTGSVCMRALSLFLCIFVVASFFQLYVFAESEAIDAKELYQQGQQLFASGNADPQNLLKGIALTMAAAEAGSAEAMVQIGVFLNSGLGKLIYPDFEDGTEADLAYSWYVKAGEAGARSQAAEALSVDAFRYFLGTEDGSIVEDDAVALQYFQKAAEYGDPDAINMMFSFYAYGFGVEQDSDKALEVVSALADQGNDDALYLMEDFAYAFYAGNKDGIDINFETAFKYYLKLTDYENERAMYNVGLLYEYGLGVSKDHEKAVEWLTKAKEAGYSPAEGILSQFNNNQ